MRSRIVVWLGVAEVCVGVAQAHIAPVSVWGADYTFRLQGTLVAPYTYQPASFTLNGGYMAHTNELIAIATFTHNAGTNRVPGMLGMSSMSSTYYVLHGGLLDAESVIMAPIGSPCRFNQSGGVHRVNRLVMQTFEGRDFLQSIYTMEWGELEVRDVTLLDTVLFEHKNGTVRHTGVLTVAGGTWQAKPGMQELGRLLVARSVFGSSNSNLSLPAEPCVVRFADSRTQNWETNAFLLIRNWDGSPDGDGEHQVLFGDGSGITAQQLAQIRFVNVVGQLPGTFPAKQTATGEIVPVIGPEAPPVLRITSRTSGHIYLQWPVGYTLESATNAAGPFADVWGVYQNPPNRSGSAVEWCHPDDQIRVYRLRK